MSEAPVQLIVAAFNDEHEADLALKELKRAKKEKLIGIQAAAVIRRDQKNKMHIKEVGELTGGKGAVGGVILGVALGIITGGAGLLLGAVGALVGGMLGKAHDTGFDNQRLKAIGESLKPGSSAIVAVIEHRWVEDLENELEELGADVMTAQIAADIHDSLEKGMDVSYSALSSDDSLIVEREAVGEDRVEVSQVIINDDSVESLEAFATGEGVAFDHVVATEDAVSREVGVISEEGAVVVAALDDGEEVVTAIAAAVPEGTEAIDSAVSDSVAEISDELAAGDIADAVVDEIEDKAADEDAG